MTNRYVVSLPKTNLSRKFRAALKALGEHNVKVNLTNMKMGLISCEDVSNACRLALEDLGASVQEESQMAPEEAPTEPWPSGLTLCEGLHFEVRDEPETFPESFNDTLAKLVVANILNNTLPNAVVPKSFKAEVSHPILGSIVVNFTFDPKTNSLVNNEEVSMIHEGLDNPVQIQTLKLKFIEEPFKDKVKYLDVNPHMSGGLRMQRDNSLSFEKENVILDLE